jgi:hypothetical protein
MRKVVSYIPYKVLIIPMQGLGAFLSGEGIVRWNWWMIIIGFVIYNAAREIKEAP